MKSKLLWTQIVRLLHGLLVLFMIVAPFTNNCEWVFIHSIGVPFLYIHWVLNNDTCALTEVEKILTGKKSNTDTFIGSVVSPVYKLDSGEIKMITLLLWSISLSKVIQCPRDEIIRMLIPKFVKK